MKKNIAIIMGGYSSEVAISIKSGNVVYKHLDTEKYNSYRIHIVKEGWFYIDSDENKHSVNKDDFSIEINGEKIVFDCVFNAIHGAPGENGAP